MVVLTSSITLAQGKVALYASVGPELAHYQVDVASAALTKRDSVTLPDNVQYAWPHPSGRYIYVAWSNGALYALNPNTGATLASISVGSVPHFATPTLSGGMAFVGTSTGVVAIKGV